MGNREGLFVVDKIQRQNNRKNGTDGDDSAVDVEPVVARLQRQSRKRGR